MDTEFDRINAAALLLARGLPAQPALVSRGRCVAYGELRRLVPRAATRWQEAGLEPGALVMLRGDHGLDHVVAFLGAIWAGAVPVPLRASLAQHAAEVEFAMDATPHHSTRSRAAGATAWTAWRADLANVTAAPSMPCEPWAPACWTEPRSWSEGRALVLPHRFALKLMAYPGMLQLARTGSMLAVLRALRRGVTATLAPGRPALATA